MSPRTFARRFLASTGTTPYRWLLRQRIQFAQRLLEMTDMPIDSVAQTSGFSTAANLRKHFSRTVHTSPHAYRRTFQARHATQDTSRQVGVGDPRGLPGEIGRASCRERVLLGV